jgi:5-methylcytosine-specific restriction endonuclease McrA
MLRRRKPRRPKRRIERDGEFTRFPKKVRLAAARMFCSVCGVRYGHIKDDLSEVKQAIDHIFPRRFLAKRGLNPHVKENLLSVCGGCHGRKLAIETSIFAGDVFSFLEGLNRLGYPMDRVYRAAEFYGFREVRKFRSP